VYAFAAHPSVLSLVETNGGDLGARVSAMSKDVTLWNDESYEALREIMKDRNPTPGDIPDALGGENDARLTMMALLRASSSEELNVLDQNFGEGPSPQYTSISTSALKLTTSHTFPPEESDGKTLVSIVMSTQCEDFGPNVTYLAHAYHFVAHVLDKKNSLYYEFEALQGGLLQEGRNYDTLQSKLTSDCGDGKGYHYMSLYE
jgi:hypothetical protein